MDLEKSLQELASPNLDTLFWSPRRMGRESAWWAHVPFAFWCMAACRPRLFVELGTHNGVSYSAFCEANLRTGLGSRCYAVDTWTGDEHSGRYDEEVYNDLRNMHDRRYSAFSEMLRCTFDEALPRFQEGAIDLLHIDGLHTYDAVRHDFESWQPKLSDSAVVLFHDTNVLRDDFGVHKLFAELAVHYPHFEFLHGHGLGVLALGKTAPESLKALCALSDDPVATGTLRERFAHLGARWHTLAREQLGHADLRGRLTETARKLTEAKAAAAHADATGKELRSEIACLDAIRDRNQARLVELRRLLVEARAETERQRTTAEELSRHLAQSKANLQSMHRAFARRYSSAFQEPSTGRKEWLKRQLLFGLQRFVPPLRAKIAAKLEVHRQRDLIQRSMFFNREWYLTQYPDVGAADIDPALHYLLHGASEGRDPGPEFSTAGYLRANPDVAAFGNPLLHYILYLEAEGREWSGAAPNGAASLDRLAAPPVASTVTDNQNLLSILYVSAEPTTPGNSYRVTRYVEAAVANGVKASWIPQASLSGHLDKLISYDVLVLWRTPWDEVIAQATAAMKDFGRTVVFDVDDLMVDPNLGSTSIIDGIRSQHLNEEMVRGHYSQIRRTMLAADICTATTHELAHHMRDADKPVFVLPNGFDQAAHDLSRGAARQWRRHRDGLIRIGYAGGSRTHQKDLGLAVDAIARVLLKRPECRLVLFRTPDGTTPLIDIEEYPPLNGLHDQIEWRPLQPLENLPNELARFDINLAPLEFGNPFCEAKSELKFFEAALVEVPTIASPTGPFRRAIEHGRTGFLAASADDWYFHLDKLAGDPALRAQVGRDAYHKALATYGPRQRALQFGRFVDQMRGGAAAARGFALDVYLRSRPHHLPRIYLSDVVFEQDKGGEAEVSVMIPLYNYEKHVVEALESVRGQTLETLDLIVVDDHSTDNSLAVALNWARANVERFNRVLVLRNAANYGLGLCRNSGFDAADTSYVMLLDADNRLLPECCARLLATMRHTGKAFIYPSIRQFGASDRLISAAPYVPQRFVPGNYIDAMALVSKEAWAMVGGIDHVRFGWEDYDLWCRFAEMGMAGEWLPEVLAEYRVHPQSMLTTQTLAAGNYRRLQENFTTRHPWVWLRDRHLARVGPYTDVRLSATDGLTRLDQLLAILRCPVSGQKLGYNEDRTVLRSYDGLQSWPIIKGRPVLSPLPLKREIHSLDDISDELPEAAQDIIRTTSGWVMNLSAGGSRKKFEHVVEVEHAISRYTDVVADAHALPFDDASFDAVIAMNTFEHYSDPRRVAAEVLRVLKPGGRVHIRTAFLQPQNKHRRHFYHCTRHGLEEWFRPFEIERLHVSENFCPNHTISRIAAELDQALRNEVSPTAEERFGRATVADFAQLWTNPSKRVSPLWTDLERLPQSTQEVMAAGFELIGRKPLNLPDLSA